VEVHQVRRVGRRHCADLAVRATVVEQHPGRLARCVTTARHHGHQVVDAVDAVGRTRGQPGFVGDEHPERLADVVERPGRVGLGLRRDQLDEQIAVLGRDRSAPGRMLRHQCRRRAAQDDARDLCPRELGFVAIEGGPDVAAAIGTVAHGAALGEHDLGAWQVEGLREQRPGRDGDEGDEAAQRHFDHPPGKARAVSVLPAAAPAATRGATGC